jgi:cell filamentation protein
MSDPQYCYPPDFTVLRNKLGIRDAEQLEIFERRLAMQRIAEGAPTGDFDLKHLRAIHRHLFQDVYDWAGELRTVEIAKGGSQFQFQRFIGAGMADVHRRLIDHNFLQDLSRDDFAREAGMIIGDVNYVHPFREGNGRTQLLYLEQLAIRAGHPLSIRMIDRDQWMEASQASHGGDYAPITNCIRHAVEASTKP